jgi:hypothetical protein
MNRTLLALALALSLSGGPLLAPSSAEARPGPAPDNYWCPGQTIPKGVMWNMATCHQYHYETRADGTQAAVPGP